MTERLRVCYFGTYRANYARNQILIEGLRRSGVEVIECHETLWHGVEDRVQVASGGWLQPSFWWRVARTYLRLLNRFRSVGDFDVLVAGYPGQYDVFPARILSWLRRKPLVWDVLNSMYLIAVERGIAARHPFTASLIRGLEKLASRLPDLLILDTAEFVDWFSKLHGVPAERFRLVPIGADDQVFRQVQQEEPVQDEADDGIFRVLYYGSYIPNHGVSVIVEAANLLRDDPSIHFEFIGEGPDREKAVALAQNYSLPNVTFTAWLEKPELARRVARAGVVLGTFGASLQASLTNNNKIYEGFALKRPVISGATPALPAGLVHGEHLYLCERGNPQSLAEAVQVLKNDPALRRRLGENGYCILYERFDVTHIGQVFAGHLWEIKNRGHEVD